MNTFHNQIINRDRSKMQGEKMIKENEFFKDLVSLMENSEFKRFFKKHLSDWISVKSTIIYMKLYDEFKSKYKKITDKELEESIIVYLLSRIMRNKELRPLSIKAIDKMYETGDTIFFEELENYIENRETTLLLE
jgi:hypothetical protein